LIKNRLKFQQTKLRLQDKYTAIKLDFAVDIAYIKFKISKNIFISGYF